MPLASRGQRPGSTLKYTFETESWPVTLCEGKTDGERQTFKLDSDSSHFPGCAWINDVHGTIGAAQ